VNGTKYFYFKAAPNRTIFISTDYPDGIEVNLYANLQIFEVGDNYKKELKYPNNNQHDFKQSSNIDEGSFL